MARGERPALYAGLLLAAGLIAYLAFAQRDLSEERDHLRERTRWLHAGDPVPAFGARTLSGDSVTVGQPDPGDRQLLVFFNTECPFCRVSTAAWRTLSRELAATAPRVRVLGVGLDEDRAALAAYKSEHDLPFPILTFPEPRTRRLYRAGLVPLLVLLGSEGTVLYSRPGVLEKEAATDSVLAAARAAAADTEPVLGAAGAGAAARTRSSAEGGGP